MLSVRLPETLEKQLEFVSLTTGTPKNTLVQQALVKFFGMDELGRLPLGEIIQEEAARGFQKAQFDQFNERQQKRQAKISQIIGWINERNIWTKRVTDCSGTPTPGIYGRNLVVGFNDTLIDEKVLVISKHLPASSYPGAASYHYDATQFEDWLIHMRQVPLQN
jgi:predicted DNA-binding protein